MTYREEQFMKQMTDIAIEVAELRAENKLLKTFNDSLIQALHKPVVSGKLTDEEIWQWVQWLDKRCNFNEHQQDYIFFVVRQILKKEACVCSGEDKTT